MEEEINLKKCLDCKKAISGRSDKRFCDDSCRNSYNYKQNSDQTNLIRKINHTLRKNRRILKKIWERRECLK